MADLEVTRSIDHSSFRFLEIDFFGLHYMCFSLRGYLRLEKTRSAYTELDDTLTKNDRAQKKMSA